jgi:DNA ligase 1
MPDLLDGEIVEMKGSGASPYVLRNTGGVYSCTCPAWRNQSVPIETRTCKHLRRLRGDDAETARVGTPARSVRANPEGEEGAGPPLLLAERWDNSADLSGWWMSEKLDGVRAYWDGKQFLSRLGNLFLAPEWFTESLPQVPLDGELWIDRKRFQRTVSIVRRQDRSEHWKEVRFVVFDAPACTGDFEARQEYLADSFASRPSPYAMQCEQAPCTGLGHLKEELARVEALGGEGLMLRQPQSGYEIGRSWTLLKIKSFQDAEAVVIGHQPGAGRHLGRLGALLVQMANGTRFSVGTGFSDAERGAPPSIGSTITFRYQELSDMGVPRFPSYVGARREIPPVAVAEVAAPSSAPPSGPPSVAATPAEGFRHFEYVGGNSSKFWEVAVEGNEMTVRYGRIGSNGQSKTKEFSDANAAQRQAEKLVAEKTGDGYVES